MKKSMRSILPIRIFRVAERSMEPTIKEGDYLVLLAFGRLGIGDIVALKHPYKNLTIIKRIVKARVDSIYVEGDNGKSSEDSRRFGFVKKSVVIGKVLLKI